MSNYCLHSFETTFHSHQDDGETREQSTIQCCDAHGLELLTSFLQHLPGPILRGIKLLLAA